jgi:hypothetical protein
MFKPKLFGTTISSVQNTQVVGFYRLNVQRFPTSRLYYSKFRIPFCSGFGFHRIVRNIGKIIFSALVYITSLKSTKTILYIFDFLKISKTSFLLIDKEYIYDEIVVSLNNV